MLDIDHFKNFNDTYGHRIGDQALATAAKLIRAHGDEMTKDGIAYLPARYGGEEFVVILPRSNKVRAETIAEQLRRMIERYNFMIRDTHGEVLKRGIRITVSIGVAQMSDKWKGAFADNLVESADRALYQAKGAGRNRVAVFEE